MAKRVLRPLTGRVVAITGGARGIGRATAAALVAQGAKVAVGDLDLGLVSRVAEDLGGDTVGLALDVSSRDSFQTFLGEVERRLGPLDVMVNNAAVMPLGPFVSESDAVAERAVDVNLHGVILGSKLALARFLPRGTGHLVNLTCVAGRVGFGGAVTYTATKHAVLGLSSAIRSEVRGTGVEVHVVLPVMVDTEMASGLDRRRARGRLVSPEQVAAAIVEALQLGTEEVYVPRVTGRIVRAASMLPPRARSSLARALRGDRMLENPDPVARAAYEARIAPPPVSSDPAKTVASAAAKVARAVAAEDQDL